MLKDFGEDIPDLELEYAYISLLSNKINALVVGGGRAGFIKAKSLADKGCRVTIVSTDFICEFNQIMNLKNVEFIEGEYTVSMIADKHLIIIATNDEEVNRRIITDCENNFKLYLCCSNFRNGNFINPVQRNTDNAVFGINTKKGSPKTSVMLAEIIHKNVEYYDNYVDYVCKIREKIKGNINKCEILNFLSTEDFIYFFNKGFGEIVLKMFYENIRGE